MKKRILSMFLALVMVLGMVPVSTMAADGYTFSTNMAAPTSTLINVEDVTLTGAQVCKAAVSNDGFVWDVLLTSCEDSIGIALTLEGAKSSFTNMAQVQLDGGKFTQAKKGVWSTTVTPDFENSDGTASYTLTTRFMTNTKTQRTFTLNLVLLPEDYTNQAPALSGEDSVAAQVLSGDTYSLDLGSVFEDPDHDDSALTYTVKVDGGAAEAADANYMYTAAPDFIGTKELIFTATDPEGLTSEEYTVNLTVIHNSPPAVADGAAATGEGMQALPWTLDLTTLFSDADGDTMTFTVKENGGEVKEVQANYTYTPATEGEHILVFQATDARGAASVEHTLTLTAAANPAPVLAEGMEATGTASGIIPFTYTLDLSKVFADNEGDSLAYDVKVGEEDAVPTEANYSYAPDAAGDHVLKFQAKDKAGNLSPVYTVTVTAEENPAPVLAEGVEATGTASGIIPFTYTLDLSKIFADNEGDILAYTVKIDDADAVDAAANYSYAPTQEGSHTLVFQAVDTSGNISPIYKVTLEASSNPAPTLAEGVNEESSATGYQYFAWNTDISQYFADNEGDTLTYTVKIDDAEAVSATANYSYTFDTAGEKTLVFQAADSDGNLSPTHTVSLTVKESFKKTIDTPCVADPDVGDTYVAQIHVTGPEIVGTKWNVEAGHPEDGEHSLFIRLTKEAADDAVIALSYTPGYKNSGFKGRVSGPASVTLVDGKADVTVKTTGWMSSGIPRTYTLHFTNEANLVPEVTQDAPASAQVNTGEAFTLDLSAVFADANGDALTYTVQEGDGEAVATEAVFSKTIGTSGEHIFVFTATDPWGDSVSHTVTVTAAMSQDTQAMTVQVPEGISPVFSVTAGYDSDGVDLPGEALTAVSGEAQNGLVPYTVRVPKGIETISVRADGWGGMAFPADAENPVTLRKVQMNVVDYNKESAENTSSVTYGDHAAAFGTDGHLLLVTGTEYSFCAVPKDTANFVKTSETKTLEDGEGVYVLELMLDLKDPVTITVTTGAKAQLYKYNQYYSNTELDAKIIKDNGDGTTTYSFIADTTSGNYMYRVSMEGKITKAGWLAWGTQDLTVKHTDGDKANTWRLDDYSAAGQNNSGITEDSVLLNINGRNHWNLSVGQSKTLKAYRAWEIIYNSSSNYILTPDFTYTILSGQDVVKLEEKKSPSTADGDWMTLTAQKEGTAVIEVTYDAMEATGGWYDGAYGASDPARTGLVVVTVGGGDSSVNFGIDCFASSGTKGSSNVSYNPKAKKTWDAEFDTLYFTGDSGRLQFAPTASGSIQSVAVSNDKGASWTTLTAEDGTYTAKIVSGNNILRVTTESGTAYQVIRGDKVQVKLAEVQDKSDGDGIIEAGERIRVSLVGLHNPIPKMAGNYNPGYYANDSGYSQQHLNYTCNGTAIWGAGAQYNFITSANYVEIDMPEDGRDVSLTDGYIGLGVIGLTTFADGGDSHRNIPDGGCTTRGSTTTWHTRSILPEITITSGAETAPNTAPMVRQDAPTTASLELTDEVYTYVLNLATDVFADADPSDELTYTVEVNDETASAVENGYYTLVRPEAGTYTLLFTVSDGKETAQHTVTLTVTKAEPVDPAPGPGEEEEDGILGYVTVSFEDYGVRKAGETGVTYPKQLGMIVKATKVPYYKGDTIADVTLRLLDTNGMTYEFTGTTKSAFYLSSIGSFSVGGIRYDSFGEFDAGTGSGWMITWDGEFINKGASEFQVENGDVIRWQYTCQLGADIGDDGSAVGGGNQAPQVPPEVLPEVPPVTSSPYTDVTGHWAEKAITFVYEKGLMTGTKEDTFSPETELSRAMLVTILYRMEGEPAVIAQNTFSDVTDGTWYTNAVIWASQNGIVNGVGQDRFAPNRDITREQMAAMLLRYSDYKDYDTAQRNDLSGYADADSISTWALEALQWANGEGLITGRTADQLVPQGDTTRAETATILMRYLETIA